MCDEFTKKENSPFKRVEPNKNIQSQLIDNQELGTGGVHKERNRGNVPKLDNTSDNA